MEFNTEESADTCHLSQTCFTDWTSPFWCTETSIATNRVCARASVQTWIHRTAFIKVCRNNIHQFNSTFMANKIVVYFADIANLNVFAWRF